MWWPAAVSVVVRDPARREYAATVDPRFVGDADGPGPDLALLEIADPAFGADLPPIGLAAVDRDSPAGEPVERCHAVGYPWFAETPSPHCGAGHRRRDRGVPVLSKLKTGLLSVQVTVAPRELPPRRDHAGGVAVVGDVGCAGGRGRVPAGGGDRARAAGGPVGDHGGAADRAAGRPRASSGGGRGLRIRRRGGRGWVWRVSATCSGCRFRRRRGRSRRTGRLCGSSAGPCTSGCRSCWAGSGS